MVELDNQPKQLVLAPVIQRYHLDPLPERRVAPQPMATLRPRDGVWMRVRER